MSQEIKPGKDELSEYLPKSFRVLAEFALNGKVTKLTLAANSENGG